MFELLIIRSEQLRPDPDEDSELKTSSDSSSDSVPVAKKVATKIYVEGFVMYL